MIWGLPQTIEPYSDTEAVRNPSITQAREAETKCEVTKSVPRAGIGLSQTRSSAACCGVAVRCASDETAAKALYGLSSGADFKVCTK